MPNYDHSDRKYGGEPRDLPTNVLPTYVDIARCIYKSCESEAKVQRRVSFVMDQLFNSWQICCPAVPVSVAGTVRSKLKSFLVKVTKINMGRQSTQFEAEMEGVKEKLFDISSCVCDLRRVACEHNRVHCRERDCTEDHFLCECPLAYKYLFRNGPTSVISVPRLDLGVEARGVSGKSVRL